MNRHLHRIVFNAARGMRMVVQETATSTGKGASKATSSGSAGAVVGAALMGMMAMVPVNAQIVGAPNVPGNLRPTVLVAPNGVPLINIQSPSAAGVSRNVYNQLNVGPNGAIFNNSRTNVQTQLGGIVQGNPFLATGPARIILNEVNGGNVSQLRGYMEVAGQRAEIIIANPAGINVDGAGFINASRATLTTGTPQLNALGGLDSFLVRGGTVTINGAGLDASKTDYAAILARAVEANAGIWASELKVVTGANQVSADHSQISPTAGTGAAPTFALDVAALGGMYAGKIVLIGTEAGLGVRNAGTIQAAPGTPALAGAGQLVVTSAGRLENIGTFQATADANLAASNLANSGRISSGGNLKVATQDALANTFNGTGGTLEGARVELVSAAGNIDNRNGGTIRQTSSAALAIAAPALSNTGGGVIGSEPVPETTSQPGGTSPGTGGGTATTTPSTPAVGSSTGSGATVTPAPYVPPSPGVITAAGAILNDGGRIYAGGPITLQSANISNNGGTLSLASMTVAQPSFDNRGGTLNISNGFSANVGNFDNTGGKLNAGTLSIASSGDLVNTDGTLTSAGDASLTVGGKADNTRGTISATGALNANVTGATNNTAGTLASNQGLTLSAGSLDNTKGSIQSAQATVQLAVANQLVNGAGGTIGASTDLNVQAGWLSNSGSMRGANDVSVAIGGALTNDGSITAARHTTITAGSLQGSATGVLGAGIQSDGTLGSAGDLRVTTTGALVANGRSLAAGNATLQGASVDLSASETSAANIAITATQGNVVTSSKAKVITPGTLRVTANGQGGQTLVNDAGTLNAGLLDLNASNIANTNGGEIVQTGTGASTIATSGKLNNDGGRIASNGQDLNLRGAAITNTGGAIEHAGAGTLGIAGGSYSATDGQITTNKTLTIALSGAFSQDGAKAKVSADRITLDAGALANRGGQIVQTGADATRITVVGAIDNTAGTLASNGNTNIAAGSLFNQGGTVRAAERSNLDIDVKGQLDNSHKGVIGAGGNATVKAFGLNNDQLGSLTASGDLTVDVRDAATNNGGTLAANGNTTLNAGTLDNSLGTVAAVKGDLSVITTGTTTNAQGTLQAGAKAMLVNGGLVNTGGKVFGDSLSVNTRKNALDNNQGGTLAANTTVDVKSGALNNDAGLIQSGGAMTVDTDGQKLTNTDAADYTAQQGGITSADTLTLTNVGAVDNKAGFIGAKNALNAQTQAFDNSGGKAQAAGDLQIDTGRLINTGGLIRSAAKTTLNTSSLANDETSGADQGIEGKNVVIGTGSGDLDNTSGAIRADVDAALTSGGTLTNSKGLISAGNELSIRDPNFANPGAKTLKLVNTDGTLVADESLKIDAASFSGDGRAVSGKDVGIALTQDIVNNGEVAANGNLTYTTTGNFTNNGKLLAGQSLTVGGRDVNNTANAEMSGTNTTVNASGTLTNRGLIDSKGETQINAGALHNKGTGRIYGDAISIAASTLDNGSEMVNGLTKAATVASRGDMDIGATTINNREHALLFSSGSMYIGGALDAKRQAIGQGAVLNNLSADIESLGDMSIAMGNVNNRDVHIQKGAPTATTALLVGIAPKTLLGSGIGRTTTYPLEEVNVDPINGFVYRKDTGELVGMGGYGIWNNLITTTEDTAINVDPAHLVAGGSMNVNGRLYNENSQVLAGGAITATEYVPEQMKGTRTATGSASVVDNTGKVQVTNLPIITAPQTIDLGAYKYQENINATTGYNAGVAPVGGAAGGAGGAGGVNGGNRPGTIVEVAANVGAVVKTSGGAAGEASGASGAGGASASQTVPMVVRTSMPNTRIPNASLFGIQAGPGSHLIETDPRFVNYRNWLSSDYLLNNLGLDPNNTLKRLGDGFYEQRLIREQVAQLTGYRYLDGFNGDDDQYAALMNEGATFAKQYGLRPGVALSAAQMAQLTSDIVWLVEQTVTLPDGTTQQVLVPQVYVRVRPGDIDGSGALLSADATIIKSSGDVTNTGTIAGRRLVSITAENINNLGGRISGGQVALDAKTDLNIIGGTVDARDAALLTAGRDINIRTTTQSAGGMPNNTAVDRVAGVYVSNPGGVLLASAERDVNLVGAILANSGKDSRTLVKAGRDVNLGTVTESSTVFASGGNASNSFAGVSSRTREIGSSIMGGGSVAITAGNDVNARAADVAAAGTLAVTAERDIRIDAGQASQALLTTTNSSRKTLTSKSSSSEIKAQADTTVLGSSFSGKDVVMSAGNDLVVRGSYVSAQNQLALSGGRDVRIESAQEQSANGTVSRSSQSGFKGLKDSVLYGKGYSSSSSNQTQLSASTKQVGSTISGGSVSIDAGRDAQIIASNVLADKNIAITAGRNIDVLAAQDTSVSATASSGKSRSFSPSPGLAPRHTLYSNVKGSEDGSGESSTAVTSLISANGGNLTMVAGLDSKYAGTGQGNITTEGADLLAKDKVSLSGNAVNLNTSTDSGSSKHHAQSKSHTIGAQLSGIVGSAITSAYDAAQESRKTDDSRLKGALQLKAGYDAYKLATDGALGNGIQGLTDPGTGGDPSGAAFGVSVSESRTRSRSDTAEVYSNQRGTNIQAGSIDITARETDINLQGAKLQARDIALDAKRDINMLAAENKAATLSTNSGSSLGGGVTFGFGSQNGFSIQVNAGSNSGKATGLETRYDNTLITATNSVTVKSGGDLNMKGAQITADTVKADIGGNLNIESLQDGTTYNSKQSSSGLAVSLCIPPICYGQYVTATVNASRQKVDHNYRSATGQSGIAAGNGGYEVTVKGNTDLKGGAITSTGPESKNSLATGSLTTSDLENRQDTNSSSSAVSLSFSYGPGAASNVLSNAARSATNTALANLNSGKGLPGSNSESSQTLSIISPGTVKIVGTGNKEIDDKSVANVATLTTRDPATANGALVNTLTLQQAKEIPRLQQQAQDRQRAAQLVGSVINNAIGDVALKAGWKEGGTEKIVLHTIAGIIQAKIGDGSALTGALAGALNEVLLPEIEKVLSGQGIHRYNADGTPNREFAELLAASSTILGAAVGAATGNAGLGATVANNATVNNRLLHENEKAKIKQLANGDADLERKLTEAACFMTRCADGKRDGDPAKADLQATDQAVSTNANGEYTRALELLRNAQTATLFNYTEADQRLDRLNSLDPRNVGGLNSQEQQAKNQNIEACRGVQSCTNDVNARYDRLVSDRAETTITAINSMKSFDQCAAGDTACAAGSLVQLQAVRADMRAKGISTDQTDVIGLNSRIARAALAVGDEAVFKDIAGAAVIGANASNAGNAGSNPQIPAAGHVPRLPTAEAERLGIKLENIVIVDGVATVRIDLTNTITASDIQKVVAYARSMGATSARVDTGFLGNDKLEEFMNRRVQDGKLFFGGKVEKNPAPNGDFYIVY